MPSRILLAGLFALTAVGARKAAGQSAGPVTHETLRYDLPLDAAVTTAGAAGWATWEFVKTFAAPSECRWCDRNADGSDSLNEFDAWARRTFRWSSAGTADVLSTVLGSAVMPLGAIGADVLMASSEQRTQQAPIDLLVIAEAVVIAANANELTKFVFARQRPDVHARTPAERVAMQTTEDNISFSSGHTTIAFALATATGTVASLRRYPAAPAVWAVGLLLAAGTGYLRVAADRHYATDVLAGGAIGASIGLALPYLAHRPEGPRIATAPLPGGAALSLSTMF